MAGIVNKTDLVAKGVQALSMAESRSPGAGADKYIDIANAYARLAEALGDATTYVP